MVIVYDTERNGEIDERQAERRNDSPTPLDSVSLLVDALGNICMANSSGSQVTQLTNVTGPGLPAPKALVQ